jgi:hypothetical protein
MFHSLLSCSASSAALRPEDSSAFSSVRSCWRLDLRFGAIGLLETKHKFRCDIECYICLDEALLEAITLLRRVYNELDVLDSVLANSLERKKRRQPAHQSQVCGCPDDHGVLGHEVNRHSEPTGELDHAMVGDEYLCVQRANALDAGVVKQQAR